MHVSKGGAAILKVGVQIRERSEQKKFLDPPSTFGLPGGHKILFLLLELWRINAHAYLHQMIITSACVTIMLYGYGD